MTAGAAERLYPARPFLAASVAVVRGDRVLLAQRSRPPAQALYTLPGGLVEAGETLAEAALRELREETGAEADIAGFLGPVEVIERDPEGRVRHHFVVCAHAARWRSGEPEARDEATAVRWVREDEVAALPTTSGLGDILRRAFALCAGGG